MNNLQSTLDFLQRQEPDKEFIISLGEIFWIDVICKATDDEDFIKVTQQYIESACMRWLIKNYQVEIPDYDYDYYDCANITPYFNSNDLSVDSIITLANEMEVNSGK